MNWSRVKTILIVLLVAVNAFLICAYVSATYRRSNNEDLIKTQLCQVMKKQGFELYPAQLPSDAQMHYPARISRNTKSERTVFESVLEKTAIETTVGATKYTGVNGNLTIRSGAFAEGVILFNKTEKDSTDKSRLVLNKLKAINVTVTRFLKEEAETQITGICQIQGLPIFNCSVKGSYDEEGFAFNGRIPLGDVSYMQNITPYALSGLMLNFAQHMNNMGINGGKINKISPGYAASTAAEFEIGVTELIPVWCINLDGHDWYINALTGAMLSME